MAAGLVAAAVVVAATIASASGVEIYTTYTVGSLPLFACPQAGVLSGLGIADFSPLEGVRTAAECARQCILHIDCLSFDYSNPDSRCNLRSGIEGDTGITVDAASGYEYYEKVTTESIYVNSHVTCVYGCTDPAASNYNAAATETDHSCGPMTSDEVFMALLAASTSRALTVAIFREVATSLSARPAETNVSDTAAKAVDVLSYISNGLDASQTTMTGVASLGLGVSLPSGVSAIRHATSSAEVLSSGWTVLEAATELAIVAAQHVQCAIGVSAESYCSEDQTHLDGNAVAGLDDSLATLAAVTSDCAEAVSAKLAGGGNHSVVEAAIGTLVGIIGDAMRERLSLNGDGSFATSNLTTGAFSLAVARRSAGWAGGQHDLFGGALSFNSTADLADLTSNITGLRLVQWRILPVPFSWGRGVNISTSQVVQLRTVAAQLTAYDRSEAAMTGQSLPLRANVVLPWRQRDVSPSDDGSQAPFCGTWDAASGAWSVDVGLAATAQTASATCSYPQLPATFGIFIGPAPVDCVGSWAEWGNCSMPCGAGTHARMYTVATPTANGGAECGVSNRTTESRSCYNGPCPGDCIGAWGVWGSCNAMCGGGNKTRQFVVERAVAHGGTNCSATNGSVVHQACGTEPCPEPEPEPEPELEPGPEPEPEQEPETSRADLVELAAAERLSADAVRATLTLTSINIDDIGFAGSPERSSFETSFKADTAAAAGCLPTQIVIVGIGAGSVVVLFDIVFDAESASGASTLSLLQQALSSGTVTFAGSSAVLEVVTLPTTNVCPCTTAEPGCAAGSCKVPFTFDEALQDCVCPTGLHSIGGVAMVCMGTGGLGLLVTLFVLLAIGSCCGCGVCYLHFKSRKRNDAYHGDTAQNIKQLGELLSAATDLGGGGSFVNGGGSMNAKRKVKGSVSLTEESLYEVARQNLATDQAADEESQQIPRSEGTKGTPRLTSDEISHPNAVAGGGSSKKLRSESTKLRSESTSKKLRSEGTKLQSESTKLRSESRRKKKEKPAPEGDDPAPDAEAEPKAEADTLGRQGEVEHLSKKLTASSFKDSGRSRSQDEIDPVRKTRRSASIAPGMRSHSFNAPRIGSSSWLEDSDGGTGSFEVEGRRGRRKAKSVKEASDKVAGKVKPVKLLSSSDFMRNTGARKQVSLSSVPSMKPVDEEVEQENDEDEV